MQMADFDYDVIVIGSGFGGSVAALRATEKGYKVGVMEAGGAGRTAPSPRPTGTSGSTSGSPRPRCTACSA
jgi:cholesterol oxidase